MQMLEHIGLLYLVEKLKLFILIVFVVEHVPEEIKEFIENNNMKAKIFRVQSDNWILLHWIH